MNARIKIARSSTCWKYWSMCIDDVVTAPRNPINAEKFALEQQCLRYLTRLPDMILEIQTLPQVNTFYEGIVSSTLR